MLIVLINLLFLIDIVIDEICIKFRILFFCNNYGLLNIFSNEMMEMVIEQLDIYTSEFYYNLKKLPP